MRQSFVLVPKVGVPPVLLGMTRTQVYQVMGRPDTVETRPTDEVHYYLDNAFQVSYAQDGTVEFVELWRSPAFDVVFREVRIRDLGVREVVRLVAEAGSYREVEPGAHFVFPDLSLAFWRPYPVTPNSSDGDEYGGAFATFAIATAGYFTGGYFTA